MEATMADAQAAVCLDSFANPQERGVSFSVGQDGEIKYWDGGEQCEVVAEGTYDEAEECTPASSSDSPHTEYELDERIVLAMSEEDPRMDGELAKRLSELDAVPLFHHFKLHVQHVPKVNAEIPLVEASSDLQRLQDRLSYFGLVEKKIAGDGNCQFRALSDQLYRTPVHHMFVRKRVVEQLARERNAYSGYVPMEYSKYLKNMSKYGEWGDHVTLQAAADYYGVKISLITTFKESGFIEISPAKEKSQRGSPLLHFSGDSIRVWKGSFHSPV